MTKQNTVEKKIINILLEFDSDAKRGYFHEPRTEKEILTLVAELLAQTRKETREADIAELKRIKAIFETDRYIAPMVEGLNAGIEYIEKLSINTKEGEL